MKKTSQLLQLLRIRLCEQTKDNPSGVEMIDLSAELKAFVRQLESQLTDTLSILTVSSEVDSDLFMTYERHSGTCMIYANPFGDDESDEIVFVDDDAEYFLDYDILLVDEYSGFMAYKYYLRENQGRPVALTLDPFIIFRLFKRRPDEKPCIEIALESYDGSHISKDWITRFEFGFEQWVSKRVLESISETGEQAGVIFFELSDCRLVVHIMNAVSSNKLRAAKEPEYEDYDAASQTKIMQA